MAENGGERNPTAGIRHRMHQRVASAERIAAVYHQSAASAISESLTTPESDVRNGKSVGLTGVGRGAVDFGAVHVVVGQARREFRFECLEQTLVE